MQAAIQLIKTEIKNLKGYIDWSNERLRTGDLQDSSIEFYDEQVKVTRQAVRDHEHALALLTRANIRGRLYVQAISYLVRLRNYITRLLGPRFPVTVDSVRMASGERTDQDARH